MDGGIGRNGAVRMGSGETAALTLLEDTGRYTLSPGVIHNLLADRFVSSHSDIANIAVANAVLAAVRS